jgi:hypothetical protein
MEKRIIVTKKVIGGEIQFIIEGNDNNYGRSFCGHTSESDGSLFRQSQNTCANHNYGLYSKDFAQEKLWPKLKNDDTAQEYANKIIKRIIMIKKWVNECKELDKKLSNIGIAIIPD